MRNWKIIIALLAAAFANPALAENEDAGPLMVGSSFNGGVLCSAKDATGAGQTISIEATDQNGAVLGTAGPAAVAADAELQLVLPFHIVRLKSVTCHAEGDLEITSSISIKSTQQEAVEALKGMDPVPAVVKNDAQMVTAAGTGALENNDNGMNNTAFGFDALMQNTDGNDNTAVGKEALQNNTVGNQNTAVGRRAGRDVTGIRNTAVGEDAMRDSASGQDNTAMGTNAMAAATGGDNNTAVGAEALEANTGDSNTAVGKGAMTTNTSGHSNVAVGREAMEANTEGRENVAVGKDAYDTNATGRETVAVGFKALDDATSSRNTAVGWRAGENVTSGKDNIYLGHGVGPAANEDDKIRIGNQGTQNETFVAGIRGNTVPAASRVVFAHTDGELGTEVTEPAMDNVRGNDVGNDGLVMLVASSDEIGTISTNPRMANVSGNGLGGNPGQIVYIRSNGELGDNPTGAFTNGVRGVATGVADAVSVLIDSAGQLGTMNSSRSVKDDIAPMADASSPLHALRPVSFRYKAHQGQAPLQYGFVAEEVAEVMPELVVRDEGGEPNAIRWHLMHALLVNEVQKQQQTIDSQRGTIEALVQRLEALESRVPAPPVD